MKTAVLLVDYNDDDEDDEKPMRLITMKRKLDICMQTKQSFPERAVMHLHTR
jgi:hypothetical protein